MLDKAEPLLAQQAAAAAADLDNRQLRRGCSKARRPRRDFSNAAGLGGCGPARSAGRHAAPARSHQTVLCCAATRLEPAAVMLDRMMNRNEQVKLWSGERMWDRMVLLPTFAPRLLLAPGASRPVRNHEPRNHDRPAGGGGARSGRCRLPSGPARGSPGCGRNGGH